MNRLNVTERARILGCLVEGNSLRSTARITGYAINTVVKLLVDIGKACVDYQDKTLRNLPCTRLECDEIWSFCAMKEKNVPTDLKGTLGFGDVWTWTAICADTKLIPAFLIGDRSAATGSVFMNDLASRLTNRVQLTTDGHKAYLNAVEGAFGSEIDYAMLVKIYEAASEGARRYSPPSFAGADKTVIKGHPDMSKISTSYAERQNLTMRMCMRRFTRLTNAFSKKVENHGYAVALHFMWYNFGRIHKTLRVTPAMEAGISDHVWTLEEVAALAD